MVEEEVIDTDENSQRCAYTLSLLLNLPYWVVSEIWELIGADNVWVYSAVKGELKSCYSKTLRTW
jgi:hypothetical protein